MPAVPELRSLKYVLYWICSANCNILQEGDWWGDSSRDSTALSALGQVVQRTIKKTRNIVTMSSVKKAQARGDARPIYGRDIVTRHALGDPQEQTENLFHHLWQHDAFSRAALGVQIPDTIVYRARTATAWFTTAADGSITRKGKANLTSAAILKAFSKPDACDVVAVFVNTSTKDVFGAFTTTPSPIMLSPAVLWHFSE
jgi:hypothetical protein